MNNIKVQTPDEIFDELKGKITTINKSNLDDIEVNLVDTIRNATLTKQIALLERSVFFYDTLKKENFLFENNFNQYVEKDDIERLLEKLNKLGDDHKMIFFAELEDYPRNIPEDIVAKIKHLNDNEIFDKFYVMYTDFTKEAFDTAHGKASGLMVDDLKGKKDPILFGAFVGFSETRRAPIIMDRLYYIDDWVDEYCDLTLAKLVKLAPEFVKDAYGSESSMEKNLIDYNDLVNDDKLEEYGIPAHLIEKIKNLKEKNDVLTVDKSKAKELEVPKPEPKKGLFAILKGFFKNGK